MQLRDYQLKAISDTREALRRQDSLLLTSPTGSGKTALTVSMMSTAARRGKSSWFLVHRQELLDQTSRALWEQRVEHRSEEHTSELQSRPHLVCRLLLEKKKN